MSRFVAKRLAHMVFVLFVTTYTIIVLGLVALAAHVSRVGDRVLAALYSQRDA